MRKFVGGLDMLDTRWWMVIEKDRTMSTGGTGECDNVVTPESDNYAIIFQYHHYQMKFQIFYLKSLAAEFS